MFQAQNRETINSTWNVVSLKIIMTTSVTRQCFTTQHQTCKTKTKTKTGFLVSDRSCPKTDGLRPHLCPGQHGACSCPLKTGQEHAPLPCRIWSPIGQTVRALLRRSAWKLDPSRPAFQGHSRSSEPTNRSAAYDFLLTFRSNHGPISYRFC